MSKYGDVMQNITKILLTTFDATCHVAKTNNKTSLLLNTYQSVAIHR